MGSTGTGKLSDYPQGKRERTAAGGETGGEAAVDQCELALDGVKLEEVERCDYFTGKNDVPPAGTPVRVRKALVGKRVGVETLADEVVGVFPTRLNYLLACMERGYKYEGKVVSSRAGKLPSVTVQLAPSK